MAGITATYVDAETFTLVGDQTGLFIPGRRVKCDCGVDGIKYGTIVSAAYTTLTTVNLTSGSDNLTSNLIDVYYGIVGGGAENQSMPVHDHSDEEGQGGEIVLPADPVILQVDRENLTAVVQTSSVISEGSTPSSSSGAAFDDGSITLIESDSTVRVQLVIPCDSDNDAASCIALIHRSTTVLAVAACLGKKEGHKQIVFDFYDTPGSVGPHTYSVRVGVSGNTGSFNRSDIDSTPFGGTLYTNNCWLTLTEIAA